MWFGHFFFNPTVNNCWGIKLGYNTDILGIKLIYCPVVCLIYKPGHEQWRSWVLIDGRAQCGPKYRMVQNENTFLKTSTCTMNAPTNS